MKLTLLLLLLLLFLPCPWVCWLSFLPCWPIELINFLLGIPRPIYFTFTSCCAHGSAGCHFCHVGPLGLLLLSLDFHCSFTLLLPLTMSMGLLAIILAMLAHWAYYLFPWTSIAHLLYFYLLFCSWACWLSFLSCWPIGLITSFHFFFFIFPYC